MTDFFQQEENKITTLTPEKDKQGTLKNKTYYKKLFLLYPSFNAVKSPMNDSLEYFNDDMSVKTTLSQEEKKEAETALKNVQETAKPYEERLLKKTNSLVQEHAISQCIETLQSYMDIDVSQQKNLIENFKALTDTDAISHQN